MSRCYVVRVNHLSTGELTLSVVFSTPCDPFHRKSSVLSFLSSVLPQTQPPSRLGHGGGDNNTASSRHAANGGGNGSARSFSNPRPLKDLSLRGMRVSSTAPKSPPPPHSSSFSGSAGRWNHVNSRLGLVAAASQRQGKRASQEDRTAVAADLAEALAGKVVKEKN